MGALLLALVAGACRGEDGGLPPGVPLDLHLDGRFALTADRPTDRVRTLVLEAPPDRVVVRSYPGLTDAAARTKAADARFLVSDLFTQKTSPYPGSISDSLACPEELRPVSAERTLAAGWRTSLRLLANPMHVFGVCDREDARYDAALVHVYCAEAQTLFEIKAFTPTGGATLDLDAWLAAVDCAPRGEGSD